jgi:hypothetical protein
MELKGTYTLITNILMCDYQVSGLLLSNFGGKVRMQTDPISKTVFCLEYSRVEKSRNSANISIVYL